VPINLEEKREERSFDSTVENRLADGSAAGGPIELHGV
jgi:hypothetical protein